MPQTAMKKHYHRKRHSVSLLHAHLVFCTKYRRQVLTPKVFAHLRASITKSAKALNVHLEAIECDKDHLHVLFCYPPSLALSTIAQRLKGTSSRFIRQQKLPEVMRKLWGKSFWSPSYFVVSCGGAALDIVKTYVDTQQTRSSKRTTSTKFQSEKEYRPAKPALIEAQSASISSIHTTTHQKPALYPRTEVRGFRRDTG